MALPTTITRIRKVFWNSVEITGVTSVQPTIKTFVKRAPIVGTNLGTTGVYVTGYDITIQLTTTDTDQLEKIDLNKVAATLTVNFDTGSFGSSYYVLTAAKIRWIGSSPLTYQAIDKDGQPMMLTLTGKMEWDEDDTFSGNFAITSGGA